MTLFEPVDIDDEYRRSDFFLDFSNRNRVFQPVEKQAPVGQACQIVCDGILLKALFRFFLFGNVRDCADAAQHFAVRTQHRPGFQREPVIMAITGTDAKLLTDAAAPVFKHHVERRAEAVTVIGVEMWQPGARRAVQGIGVMTSCNRQIRLGDNPVTGHIPVPDEITGTGNCHGLAFHV